MTLHIYDAMCVVRRELETDVTGRAPRKIATDMLTLAQGDVAIWCWDAPGSRKTRQTIFPGYKAKRVAHPDDIWPLIHLLKQVFLHTNAIQIEVPGFEADDIIGELVRSYPQHQKHVHSTDGDLVQCFDGNTTSNVRAKVLPRWVRLYKTCVGDPSDNIPGIKGFGIKTWDGMTDDQREHLQALIQGGDPCGAGEDFLPPRVFNWLSEPENARSIVDIWKIVGLMPIPPEKLKAGMTTGRLDAAAADTLLKKYRH